MPDERPNIVLIMADDMGYSDLGCYGGEIATPNLDRMAAEGLRFTQFYNNGLCMPTRASLLTGLFHGQVAVEPRALVMRADNNVTLAEVLRGAGYRTLMAGKWHNGNGDRERPVRRGFDRYWGLLSGCGNYFNPGLKRDGEPEPAHKFPGNTRPWGDEDEVVHPFTPEDRRFYTTDAFTAKALEFLETHGREEQPFFLYLAHCAPHYPMHAWPEDIARYRGRYRCGWQEIRLRRFRRQREIGLIDSRWGLSEPDSRAPAWESTEEKDAWDLRMSIYAAMVDRLDQGIGAMLAKLRELGKEENTLVLFLSDNGASGERYVATPDAPPGGVDSYYTLDAPWANASNTPFRLFKAFDHEGGVCTPLIARWPRVIRQGGRFTGAPGHIVDFMPTFAELAGAEYPRRFEGREVLPMDGQSLAPVLRGEQPGERPPIFWELGRCRALRQGRWKLVTQGPRRADGSAAGEPGPAPWELYDMETDRCELRNLAAQQPERVAAMERMWQAWRRRCEAVNPLLKPGA
ncbi:MAG: arylsulfatase [Armatimonadetes bacterium]|nr:arylsulfatase [Armatimonadota bacterium]